MKDIAGQLVGATFGAACAIVGCVLLALKLNGADFNGWWVVLPSLIGCSVSLACTAFGLLLMKLMD